MSGDPKDERSISQEKPGDPKPKTTGEEQAGEEVEKPKPDQEIMVPPLETDAEDPEAQKSLQRTQNLLVLYIVAIGLFSVLAIIANFPSFDIKNEKWLFDDTGNFLHILEWLGSQKPGFERRMILLAFLSGMCGSFLHFAPSLSAYIGNRTFNQHWTAWYFIRPWTAGVLGVVIYFVMGGGFITLFEGENPKAVIAICLLGGWFSKTTVAKLKELFETMFQSAVDAELKDKVNKEKPTITAVVLNPDKTQPKSLLVQGKEFLKGAVVWIDGKAVSTTFKSKTLLVAQLPSPEANNTKGKQLKVQVKNPAGEKPTSAEYLFKFPKKQE